MNFVRAEALGNTFLIFDALDQKEPNWRMALQLLLEEKRDDALILTHEKSEDNSLYLKMHVLGADGSFGVFCGNGSRAVAAYLFQNYPQFSHFYLNTAYGLCSLHHVKDEIYKTIFPWESNASSLYIDGRTFFYTETLEPHLAIEADLSDEELFDLGRKMNSRKDIFPNGINVNAWKKISSTKIFVKTYERGVQRLTRSCGTGSAACAFACLSDFGSLNVSTPGGPLSIVIHNKSIELIGAATL